jgi:hypothetical protein
VSDAPESTSYDSTNILIEGNSFSGFGTTPSVFGWNWPVGPAIAITNAAQVMIRGNTLGPLAESAPNGTPKILVERSVNVQIIDNQDISAPATSWLATPADANSATASNWNPAAAPGDLLGSNTNADTATFNATVSNGSGTTSPVVMDAGRNLKSITFNTAAASAYVIGTTGGPIAVPCRRVRPVKGANDQGSGVDVSPFTKSKPTPPVAQSHHSTDQNPFIPRSKNPTNHQTS